MDQENHTMSRQSAVALIIYLQKAHGMVPTTGQEWTALQNALQIVEAVANGRAICEVKQTEIQRTNGKSLDEVRPSA